MMRWLFCCSEINQRINANGSWLYVISSMGNTENIDTSTNPIVLIYHTDDEALRRIAFDYWNRGFDEAQERWVWVNKVRDVEIRHSVPPRELPTRLASIVTARDTWRTCDDCAGPRELTSRADLSGIARCLACEQKREQKRSYQESVCHIIRRLGALGALLAVPIDRFKDSAEDSESSVRRDVLREIAKWMDVGGQAPTLLSIGAHLKVDGHRVFAAIDWAVSRGWLKFETMTGLPWISIEPLVTLWVALSETNQFLLDVVIRDLEQEFPKEVPHARVNRWRAADLELPPLSKKNRGSYCIAESRTVMIFPDHLTATYRRGTSGEGYWSVDCPYFGSGGQNVTHWREALKLPEPPVDDRYELVEGESCFLHRLKQNPRHRWP